MIIVFASSQDRPERVGKSAERSGIETAMRCGGPGLRGVLLSMAISVDSTTVR